MPTPLVQLPFPGANLIERLLGIDRLNALYNHLTKTQDLDQFLSAALDDLNISYHIPLAQLQSIPKTGPLVVVSNHPFGALDGIILGKLLRSVRPDVKIFANHLLGRITELRDLFILVDPFNTETSKATNQNPLRQALRHLNQGGLLAAFPAGEVAHLQPKRLDITDPAWSTTIARIVQRTGVPVLPLFFEGGNSAMFQMLGLISPKIRTALLARELFKKRHTRVRVQIGSVLPHKRLAEFSSDQSLTDYLRNRTFLLSHRQQDEIQTSRLPAPPARAKMEEIIPPVSKVLLADDVAKLPPDQLLVNSDGMQVYFAKATQIPNILREIGRLREVTFRNAHEGSGKSIDLDTFDYDYLHLFVWQKDQSHVVGGYRLGQSDLVLPAKGRSGLYTSTLFDYRDELMMRLGPALEMGRSFVRDEYQKSYAPLLLLWKGIGHFCVKFPKYRMLFGPVSISNAYRSASKQFMVQFLQMHHQSIGTELVKPKNPYKPKHLRHVDASAVKSLLQDSDDLSDLVSDLEPDQKGVPVLLRQYLKLGAKILAFNVDPDFSDVLDALIVVDLAKTEPRTLHRYMTREGYDRFISHHAVR